MKLQRGLFYSQPFLLKKIKQHITISAIPATTGQNPSGVDANGMLLIPKSDDKNESGRKRNANTVKIFIISFCLVDNSELLVSRISTTESRRCSRMVRT